MADPTQPDRRPAEDFRVRQARKDLADAKAAVDDMTRPYEPEVWAGRLGVAVELLLQVIDERDAR